MDKNFCPENWHGSVSDFTRYDVYPWIKLLPKNQKIFCSLWNTWESQVELPAGFKYYLISFHNENINFNWLVKQRKQVDGKFIVLFSGNLYDVQLENTEFISYINWHNDINKIINWHGIKPSSDNKKFKFSAVCNRITQSKIWITTKLFETSFNDSLIFHNPAYFENKNVHNWELTGNAWLDALTITYIVKYKNLKLSDDFNPATDTVQCISSNPWQPLYTDTALHFTNGSFHYSLMHNQEKSSFIYPGPDIDEKTLKCLVAGTPFVACAQFEVYKTLSSFGLNFDYDFDLTWDNDSDNLLRFEKICNLIDYLSQFEKDDIVAMTKMATQHNLEFIHKGGFYQRCEVARKLSIEKILDCF
jgi:hypothetical protein